LGKACLSKRLFNNAYDVRAHSVRTQRKQHAYPFFRIALQ
jgi:hypothetical protein